jgi:hypothetical protein
MGSPPIAMPHGFPVRMRPLRRSHAMGVKCFMLFGNDTGEVGIRNLGSFSVLTAIKGYYCAIIYIFRVAEDPL